MAAKRQSIHSIDKVLVNNPLETSMWHHMKKLKIGRMMVFNNRCIFEDSILRITEDLTDFVVGIRSQANVPILVTFPLGTLLSRSTRKLPGNAGECPIRRNEVGADHSLYSFSITIVIEAGSRFAPAYLDTLESSETESFLRIWLYCTRPRFKNMYANVSKLGYKGATPSLHL